MATRLPLTGRDAELDALRDALAAARDGTGRLVEIVGDMGSGKTRLLTEALAGDIDPIVVHCEPYHRSTPFHPFRTLLEVLLDDGVDRVDALAELVAEHRPSLAPFLPLLGDVLDVAIDDTDETRILEERYRLQRTVAVTVELLRSVLTKTTILVIEDVHWLDETSAVVLQRIEAQVAETSWLVCVTRRDEAATFVPKLESSTSIRLAPLSEGDMAALVGQATEASPLPPHRRDELIARAAGNPLYLTELLAGSSADSALPDSLEAVMAAQIDRLPPAERRLLRLAAVLGSHFDLRTLAELSGEQQLVRDGARALTSRLQWLCIPEGAGHMRFRHQLVRDVAYESLPYRQRRELHALACDIIEHTAVGDVDGGIMSLHALHAGQHERCWHHARIAAGRAVAKHANAEARELFGRALASSKHLDDLDPSELAELWQRFGDRLALLGSIDDARDAYRRARRLAHNDPYRLAVIALTEARLAERRGNTDAVVRWIRRGLRAVEGHPGKEEGHVRASLLVRYAFTILNRGQPRRAIRWAEAALEEGERCEGKRAVAHALVTLSNIEAALGRPIDTDRATRGLRIFEELGLLAELGVALNNLGMAVYYQGEWTRAMSLLERARETMAKIGNTFDAGYCSLSIAEILIEQGHLSAAEESLNELMVLWRSVDHALGQVFVSSNQARISMHRGDATTAIDLFGTASDAFERYGLATEALDADARSAECLLRVGRVADALEAIERVMERNRALGGTRVAPRLHRVLAYCNLADGDVEGAWAAMDESLHVARSMLMPYDVALALEGLEVLSAFGARDVPAGGDERAKLLGELGVIATPAPPLSAPTLSAV